MRRAIALITLLFVYALLLGIPDARADGLTFATIPTNGSIEGPAGSTIGWGYTLTNNSTTDWLNTIGLDADPFLHAFVNALFDFPILAPGATVSVPYDQLNGSGLYELTWDADAPAGFVNTGNFDLSIEWWDGDPLAGGNLLLSDIHSIVPFSATVEGTSTAPVPEPSSLVLLATGLGALYCIKRRTTSFHAANFHQLNATSFDSRI